MTHDRPVFADTSFFLALLIPGDALHTEAIAWVHSSTRPLLMTDYVIVEVGNFLSGPATRHLFSAFLKILESNPGIRIIPASADLMRQGCDLYTGRADKSWSLTDCISFVVMRAEGITEAVTADHHFEQAGFIALLQATH